MVLDPSRSAKDVGGRVEFRPKWTEKWFSAVVCRVCDADGDIEGSQGLDLF